MFGAAPQYISTKRISEQQNSAQPHYVCAKLKLTHVCEKFQQPYLIDDIQMSKQTFATQDVSQIIVL